MTRNELKQLIEQVIKENRAFENLDKMIEGPSEDLDKKIEALKREIKAEANKPHPNYEKMRNDINSLDDAGGFFSKTPIY